MEPTWLWEWTWPREEKPGRPADLRIEHRSGEPDGYDFHLNGVAVFSAPQARGSTFVVGRQVFATVTFQDFANNLPIEAAYEDDPKDPWSGTLLVRWARTVETGGSLIWELRHPKAGSA